MFFVGRKSPAIATGKGCALYGRTEDTMSDEKSNPALTGREIVALKRQRDEKWAAAQAIGGKIITENRGLTPAEEAEFVSLQSEADKLNRIIEDAEAEAERRAKGRR